MDFIPGYDDINGNTNSVLYRTYGKDRCILYDPKVPVRSQGDEFSKIKNPVTVVHSFGFAAFVEAQKQGFATNTERLIVLDGYIPHEWAKEPFSVIIPDVPCVFVFPTVGDRTRFSLEPIVRQAMVTRNDIVVVIALHFGHNFLYKAFGAEEMKSLINDIVKLPTNRPTDNTDFIVRLDIF